ncbi:spore gernimation protein GerPD [Paenibacillus ihbetae]|uniref:Spore gernimation protein GerPD n=1 Tax=Paenibacillus ihbetae TaxID=1870820 RepID=A0A1B2DV33_9BACL|nr:spore gernimation protein GerPD [Paenibacillus ihbetae]ANY71565.1 spore gernimation protein GerPD [Paenibacillus ihbetae]OOC61076.1 spore gernimation protein GerPD [Paenibacillus ihbetae]
MKLTVINKELHVGCIRVTAVSSSSVLLIGDTKIINSSSIYDTPSESLLVSPLVPLASGSAP